MSSIKIKLSIVIEWLFYLFVFLLPWQTRYVFRWGEMNGRFEYGDISLFGIDVLLIIILTLSILWWLKFQIPNDKFQIKSQCPNPNDQLQVTSYGLRITKLWIIIALFEFTIFLSIFWSHDKSLALYGWLRVLLGIGLFWLVTSIKLNWKKIIYAVVFSGIVQAVLGIYQFITQSTFTSKWLGMAKHIVAAPGTSVVEVLDQRWLRAYGSLQHPNVLAGFLVVCFLLLVGLALHAKSRNDRTVVFTGLITILPALFFTFSRGAWIALAVCCLLSVVSLLIKRKKIVINWKMLWQISVISVIIVVALSFIYKDLVGARLAGAERLEMKSNIERINTYEQAGQILAAGFPFGVGINNYSLALHNLLDSSLESWSYQPVHNVFVLVLSEIGIVGLVLFILVLVLIKVPRSKIQVPRKDQIPNSKFQKTELCSCWNIISFATFLAMLIIMLFDHYFWTLSFGIYLFWLILALNIKTKSYDRE